jgi:predicted alpha/beta-fold hydrolase
MREMLAYVQLKQRHFHDQGQHERLANWNAWAAANLRTFWDFDGKVTAPLNGFRDVHDYYRRASSHFFLGQNRTPTLIIHSSDDPFVSGHSLPTARELAPQTSSNCTAAVGMWALSTAACAIRGTTWSGGFRSGWWTASA